jgi:hypothetical protein
MQLPMRYCYGVKRILIKVTNHLASSNKGGDAGGLDNRLVPYYLKIALPSHSPFLSPRWRGYYGQAETQTMGSTEYVRSTQTRFINVKEPGAAASQLIASLVSFPKSLTEPDCHLFKKFSHFLTCIPRTLASRSRWAFWFLVSAPTKR